MTFLAENDLSYFSLPLSATAHRGAEEASHPYLTSLNKAERIYLNSLAVYTLRYYLQLQDYRVTERKPSFIHQALTESAELCLPGYGSLECIGISADQTDFEIPLEALENRIGYVVVQFDDELGQATPLGFVIQGQETSIPLSDLQPMGELPGYLARVNPIATTMTSLERWWDKIYDSGWTLVSELVQPEEAEPRLALDLRSLPVAEPRPQSPNALTQDSIDSPQDGVICQKQIELSSYREQLLLTLVMQRFTDDSDDSVNITIRLSPDLGVAYLPTEVQLVAEDQTGMVFSSIRAAEISPMLELRFRAAPGDYFALKVVLSEVTITEGFVV